MYATTQSTKFNVWEEILTRPPMYFPIASNVFFKKIEITTFIEKKYKSKQKIMPTIKEIPLKKGTLTIQNRAYRIITNVCEYLVAKAYMRRGRKGLGTSDS